MAEKFSKGLRLGWENGGNEKNQDRTAGIEDKYSIQTPIEMVSKHNHDIGHNQELKNLWSRRN